VTDSHPSEFMLVAGRDYRIPRSVVGAIVLAVAIASCPSSARAACGEYVSVFGATAIHQWDGQIPAQPDPTPACHGLGCSKAPSSAVPVWTARIVGLRAPAAFDPAGPIPAHTAVTVAHVDSAERTARLMSDIFHPPRSV
jgi:hypothetical protein